jgi:DNA-binding GntR family transcriptional regulator
MTTPSSNGRVAARKAPSEVIASHYRERIERGALKPGEHIPSSREIAQTWRVAGRTVDRAIQRLLAEGLLSAGGEAGLGPVVASPGKQESMTVVLDGRRPGTVDAVELTEIDPEVAERLGVRPGSSMLILHFTVTS